MRGFIGGPRWIPALLATTHWDGMPRLLSVARFTSLYSSAPAQQAVIAAFALGAAAIHATRHCRVADSTDFLKRPLPRLILALCSGNSKCRSAIWIEPGLSRVSYGFLCQGEADRRPPVSGSKTNRSVGGRLYAAFAASAAFRSVSPTKLSLPWCLRARNSPESLRKLHV